MLKTINVSKCILAYDFEEVVICLFVHAAWADYGVVGSCSLLPLESLSRTGASILHRCLKLADLASIVNKYEQGIKNLEQVLLESEAWTPVNKQLQVILSKLRQKTKSLLESLKEMRNLLDGKEPKVRQKRKDPDERPLKRSNTEIGKRRGLPFGQKPFQFHYERKQDHHRDPYDGQYRNYNQNQYHQEPRQRPREPSYDQEGRPRWDNNWNNLPGGQSNSADRQPPRGYGQSNHPPPASDFGNYNYVAGFGKPPPPPNRSPPPSRKWHDNLR